MIGIDEEPVFQSFFTKKIRIVKIFEKGFIQPTELEIMADFYVDAESEKKESDIVRTTNRINFFFDTILQNSIWLSKENDLFIKTFFPDGCAKTIPNCIILLPRDPSDDIISMILTAKINSISENCGISEIKITSSGGFLSTFLFSGNPFCILPSAEEWFGVANGKEPWWCRKDFTTWDCLGGQECRCQNLLETTVAQVDSLIGFNYQDSKDDGTDFKPKII